MDNTNQIQTIPDNPEALLTREAAAAALTASGFPVKAKTLATKASRGGGPPFRSFGSRVLYRWGEALEWANSRLSEPKRSTSESEVQGKLYSSKHRGQITPASDP
jgi:hypothetical protein